MPPLSTSPTDAATLSGPPHPLAGAGGSIRASPGRSMWPPAPSRPVYGAEPIATSMAMAGANARQAIVTGSCNARATGGPPTPWPSSP
ncbi:thaumatin-like protein [Phtheirospermum japonicum]|uniref:Thaumatin-like protein n=1 Tax=Phtheirospermum japonicum TaxID=374723 RepID=A0A830BMQ9_9LAMI|nr:thaumatin-like protein [Phtheirospermum japonicum]